MKPLLLTIALLFSTPAWALNSFCQAMIRLESSVKDALELQNKILTQKCDVILVQVDRRVYHMGRIANYCRFDREIVIEDNPKKSDVHFSCVPAK